jgi:hypothetical protein
LRKSWKAEGKILRAFGLLGLWGLWFPRSGVGTRARAAPAACMIWDAGAYRDCVPTLERGYDGY